MAIGKLPVIGVMGSGREPHEEKAQLLGYWLAHEGVHLLTGGGKGVMTAVNRAFSEVDDRRGRVIGVLPGAEGLVRSKAGYPNPWVEIPIYTHLVFSGKQGEEVLSRNHINVLSSDVVVALPESAGTSSEVALAVSYRRPVICYLDSRDEIPGLVDGVPVCDDLEGIKTFVRSELQAGS